MKKLPTFDVDVEQLAADEVGSVHRELTQRLRDVSVRLGIDSDHAEEIRMQGGRLGVDETGKEIKILTGCWFDTIDSNTHIRVGISRGVPRRQPAGFRRFDRLAPGKWFRSCASVAEYIRRYDDEILAKLDPRRTLDELLELSQGRTPVLTCWESSSDVDCGSRWCHRFLVSKWFEDTLGVPVEEIGHPGLKRFEKLRIEGVPVPRYSSRAPDGFRF